MNEFTLTSVIFLGTPVLFLVSYIGSLGIPFPITLVIIAAGAFAHEGILDWQQAFLACFAGSILADNSEYLLGRLARPWLERRYSQKRIWQRSLEVLNRQGGWAILLTRFWLTPLAPAVNLVAGSRFAYARFLLFDITGELLWVVFYGGLGYLLFNQWEQVSQALSSFNGLSVLLLILAGAFYFLIQRQGKQRVA